MFRPQSTRLFCLILLACALGLTPASHAAPCAASPGGRLSAVSPRWHRITGANIDVHCGASATGTTPDRMPWDLVRVRCEEPTLLTVQFDPGTTTIQDPVLAVYCAGFDAQQPTEQLIAFNDDLPGLGKLSGFDADSGLLLPAGTYAIVISTAAAIDPEGAGDFGAYALCLGSGFTVVDPNEATDVPDNTRYHAADVNHDHNISHAELIRVIELSQNLDYGCVSPATATEDGYTPGTGGTHDCAPHDGDYDPQDWQVDVFELLRVIQLFQHDRYKYCPEAASEDGFCYYDEH